MSHNLAPDGKPRARNIPLMMQFHRLVGWKKSLRDSHISFLTHVPFNSKHDHHTHFVNVIFVKIAIFFLYMFHNMCLGHKLCRRSAHMHSVVWYPNNYAEPVVAIPQLSWNKRSMWHHCDLPVVKFSDSANSMSSRIIPHVLLFRLLWFICIHFHYLNRSFCRRRLDQGDTEWLPSQRCTRRRLHTPRGSTHEWLV